MSPAIDKMDFPPLPSQKAPKIPTQGKDIDLISPQENRLSVKTTLTDLPTELILQIISYLPTLDLNSFQLPTIKSLSQTNHRLHAVVMEHLYSGYNSFFGHPYLFLRTMISNPEAAKNVKSITLAYGHGVHEDRTHYKPFVRDRQEIKAGFKALDIPNCKTWARECNDAWIEQEMLYTAILMHTPNVTELGIDDGELRGYQVPKWIELIKKSVAGNSFGHVHHFSELRSLRVDIGTLRLSNLVPLFRLPALKSLGLAGLVETENIQSIRWSVPSRSSTIEDLHLPDCFMDTQVLTLMMDSCRALRKFEYEHRDERWYYRQGRGLSWLEVDHAAQHPDELPIVELDYPSLSDALLRHADSLEALLVFDDVEDDNHVHQTVGFLRSLRQLKKVKFLQGHLGAFLNVLLNDRATLIDNLPPALIAFDLTIKWNEEEPECLPALEHMVANLRDLLPALKWFHIKSEAPESALPYPWERLRDPLFKAGVNFAVDQKLKDTDGFESDEWEDASDNQSVSISEEESDLDNEDSSEDDDTNE